jgi:excisionase family DNA binding protein
LTNSLKQNDIGGNITDMESEFLTVQQAAEKLQMHPRTIRRLLTNGQLPGQKVGARQWRVSTAALKAHIEGGPKPVTAKGE